MALMRWQPLPELERMRQQMDRLFNEIVGHPGMIEEGPMMFLPKVEVFTTDKEAVINVELPGMEAKDVNVEVTAERVIILGETKKESEIREDYFYRSEREFGSFHRAVHLPERVVEDQAKASFKNGILTIRAPLAQPAPGKKAHKLKIETP